MWRSRGSDALVAFLDHAAAFADLDGDPSVRAFLAFLAAAEEFDRGLDTAAPTPGDSVKLMTVHKAKGLEWPVVVLPDVTAGVFPTATGRSRWTQSAKTLPSPLRGDAEDFPVVAEWSNKGIEAFQAATKELDQLEERRLGYVAVTRAKQRLVASAHWWGPTQSKQRGPSPYLDEIREHCLAGHGEVVHWEPRPEEERNPGLDLATSYVWPAEADPELLAARRAGAELVRAALTDLDGGADEQLDLMPRVGDDLEQSELLADWDRDLAALLSEAEAAHRPTRDVPLPASLSASAVLRLAADPQGLARDLARPMPRPPTAAATRGTRFHAWVEALFGVQPLLDRSDLAGAADDDLAAGPTTIWRRCARPSSPARTPPDRPTASRRRSSSSSAAGWSAAGSTPSTCWTTAASRSSTGRPGEAVRTPCSWPSTGPPGRRSRVSRSSRSAPRSTTSPADGSSVQTTCPAPTSSRPSSAEPARGGRHIGPVRRRRARSGRSPPVPAPAPRPGPRNRGRARGRAAPAVRRPGTSAGGRAAPAGGEPRQRAGQVEVAEHDTGPGIRATQRVSARSCRTL